MRKMKQKKERKSQEKASKKRVSTVSLSLSYSLSNAWKLLYIYSSSNLLHPRSSLIYVYLLMKIRAHTQTQNEPRKKDGCSEKKEEGDDPDKK